LIHTAGAPYDLERVTDFLLEWQQDEAEQTTSLIIEAVNVLENHPLVGRPVEYDLRELVISRGQSGYIALYNDAIQVNLTARIHTNGFDSDTNHADLSLIELPCTFGDD